jgi:SAM-dependent methyltransferase
VAKGDANPLVAVSKAHPIQKRLFGIVSAKEFTRPKEYRETNFRRAYRQTESMFRRFGDRVNLDGADVLDIGCGRGPTCIYAALHGARRAIGVDTDEDHIEFARAKVERDYPALNDRVAFVLTRGRLEELAGERFDLIISQNSFEHYSDPEQIVADAGRALREGGSLAIAFAPPWKSPSGGHLQAITKVPWAHLLFSEHVVMAKRRELIPHEQVFSYEDYGLNRMTLARFRTIMNRSGLECTFFATNLSDRPQMKLMRAASRLPFAEEYFTHNIYSIWRKA